MTPLEKKRFSMMVMYYEAHTEKTTLHKYSLFIYSVDVACGITKKSYSLFVLIQADNNMYFCMLKQHGEE